MTKTRLLTLAGQNGARVFEATYRAATVRERGSKLAVLVLFSGQAISAQTVRYSVYQQRAGWKIS